MYPRLVCDPWPLYCVSGTSTRSSCWTLLSRPILVRSNSRFSVTEWHFSDINAEYPEVAEWLALRPPSKPGHGDEGSLNRVRRQLQQSIVNSPH